MNMNLSKLTPMLGVMDVAKALAFYKDALGFEAERTYEPEGMLLWASARSGPVELMFCHEPGKQPGDLNPTHLYFVTGDVSGLHTKLKTAGHKVSPLRVTFYKMKEFSLTDPDGYEWLIGQETTEPPTDGSA